MVSKLPEPLSLGAIKGILLRNIRSFVHDGDITMPDGTLNGEYNATALQSLCRAIMTPMGWSAVGYKYLNFAMSEVRPCLCPSMSL
jgi:hypothetical protein